MLKGLNHLTLAVTDLNRSTTFYRDILGFTLNAQWDKGAYLSLPGLWLCLTLDIHRRSEAQPEYTHYDFTIDEEHFTSFIEHLRANSVQEWRKNRSEGSSFYFLDPDGHKLETHVGDLNSRLAACQQAPYSGMEILAYPSGTGE